MQKINMLVVVALMVMISTSVSAVNMTAVLDSLPTLGQLNWGLPLLTAHNNTLEVMKVSLTEFGFLKPNIVQLGNLNLASMPLSSFTDDLTHTVDTDTQLSEIQVDAFADNNGYLTSIGTTLSVEEIKSETISGTVHLQQNADSSARVRFFRNTLENPMINIWGYDSTDTVQKYLTIGLFDNPAFNEAGSTLRAIISSGGNTAGTRNALEIQSPDQVRITAVDDILNAGSVRIASDTAVEIYTRASAEVDSANRLVIDNVGDVVSGDMELSNPAGNVVIAGGYTGSCVSGTTLTVVGGIITNCI